MTEKKYAVAEIVKAFEAFRGAYDAYILKIEITVPEEADDETLQEQVRSLVIGSEDTGIYLRDYAYTIDAMRYMRRQ